MRVIWIAAMVLAGPALAAEPIRQFDLICTAKRANERYRVDLDREEWCFGGCQLVQKIDEISSGTIFLRRQTATSAGGKQVENRVNRTTGEWYFYSFNPAYDRSPSVTQGTCVPAEFSGFPATKF